MDFVIMMVALLAIGLLYFAPTLIAVKRDHRNMAPIAVINLLLGWSLIGWVIALAWSLTSNAESVSG